MLIGLLNAYDLIGCDSFQVHRECAEGAWRVHRRELAWRVHRGYVEGVQRVHRRWMEGAQRVCRGYAEGVQRVDFMLIRFLNANYLIGCGGNP